MSLLAETATLATGAQIPKIGFGTLVAGGRRSSATAQSPMLFGWATDTSRAGRARLGNPGEEIYVTS
jgi:hypothetical protein